jgi:hypothetical protein
MKRLLLFIPIAFLFLVNSCVLADTPSGVPNDMGTAVANTQTATVWTVAPTQTFNPNISFMVNWLNVRLMSPTNALASTLDAKYSVTEITVRNHSPMTYRIDVTCICMNEADCCIPERTFVVILESLKTNTSEPFSRIPPDVSQVMVVCFNQRNTQIGAISVSWQSVREYLLGNLTGYELGVQVTRTRVP